MRGVLTGPQGIMGQLQSCAAADGEVGCPGVATRAAVDVWNATSRYASTTVHWLVERAAPVMPKFLTGPPPANPTVIVVGLDNAGKTTLFQCLRFDPDRHAPDEATVPTIGFNMEKCRVEGVDIVLWDLGGQDRCRALWETYFYDRIRAVVFVVDGTDQDRLAQAKVELGKVLRYDSVSPWLSAAPGTAPTDGKGADVLVLVNKGDMDQCASVQDVSSAWGFEALMAEVDRGCTVPRRHRITSCSAKTAAGVFEAVHWLLVES